MQITDRAQLPADPATVFAMLCDPAYLEQVCVASHAIAYAAQVTGSRTKTTRTLAAPENMTKFAGPTLLIVEEMNWSEAAADGSRTGALTLTVTGQPVTMHGTVRLSPSGTGTVLDLEAELKVAIPLLGKKIEQGAAPAVLEGFRKHEEVGGAYLAA